MSNFLQRVAATVIQPRTRLHPMLGSIFAPFTLSLPAEFSSTQTEISSQTFAPHRHEPTHFDGPSHAFASRPFSNEDRLFPATLPEDSSSARSNLSPSADQPLLPVFSVRGRTEPHLSAEDAGPIFESSEVAAANHSISPDPNQPLIAAGRQTPPRLQQRESPPTAAAARTFASEAARRPSQRNARPTRFTSISGASKSQPSPSLLRLQRQPRPEDRSISMNTSGAATGGEDEQMSTAFAMSAVSAVLQHFLQNALSSVTMFGGAVAISVKAPDLLQHDIIDGKAQQNQINLFLHQVTYNLAWRNVGLPSLGADGKTPLDNPPLALDLHYLLTAYGSDDWQAEALLGHA